MLNPLLLAAALLAQVLPPGNGVLDPPRHGTYVVAHRGAHEGIPENTLAAYQKAIDLGCDFIEVDLRETKDGHIVSVHNATIDAYTTDAKGLVKSFTLAQLKDLDIGSRVGPQWKDERIPTFEEILALAKGKIGIYLDLKDAPVEKLIAMIRAQGMERHVIWYAGPAQQKQVAKLCPTCNPMPDPGPEAFLKLILREHKPKIVASSWDNFSESFAKSCHDAGAIVIVDEDKPEDWPQLLAWKTDGIQTDHPAKLIQFLQAQPRK